MDSDEEERAAQWTENLWNQVSESSEANRDRQKYVQFTHMPKKINARSLVSFIAQTSRTIPIHVDMGTMKYPNGDVLPAALVQFRSEQDAFKTVEMIKSSTYGRTWKMKFIPEPNFVSPTDEDMKLYNIGHKNKK